MNALTGTALTLSVDDRELGERAAELVRQSVARMRKENAIRPKQRSRLLMLISLISLLLECGIVVFLYFLMNNLTSKTLEDDKVFLWWFGFIILLFMSTVIAFLIVGVIIDHNIRQYGRALTYRDFIFDETEYCSGWPYDMDILREETVAAGLDTYTKTDYLYQKIKDCPLLGKEPYPREYLAKALAVEAFHALDDYEKRVDEAKAKKERIAQDKQLQKEQYTRLLNEYNLYLST